MHTMSQDPKYHKNGLSAPDAPHKVDEVVVKGISVGIIVLTIALLLGPRISQRFDKRRINESLETLAQIRLAVAGSNGFIDVVGTTPGTLSELTRPVWNARSGPAPFPTTGCGVAFSNEQVSSWDKAGPFLPFQVSASGWDTPIGTVADTLDRLQSGKIAGALAIVVRGVSPKDAQLVDRELDGGDGPAAGSVRWADAPQASLYYRLPIHNVC